jgi:two-component system sensor histidine kinase KdpD
MTPLTTLLVAAENLITENKKIPEQDRVFLLSEILLAATRLNRLVDNMLNMSRLESGMLQPKLDWCDYNELVHNVLNRLKPELAHHPVTLKIQDDVPLVKIDFGLIEQALYNILHNISVHTPAATEVNISVNCRNHILETTVADNGPGFREEELAMVFEKFYRTPVSKTGGLGLGLSIARGFIQAHNGTIQLAHNKPQGARFTIHIPVETTTLEPEHE